jgi:hypothetical protein
MRQQRILGGLQRIHSALAGHSASGNTRQNAGDVCASEDCHHPGHSTGRSNIDAPQTGVRMLAAQDSGVQRVWEREVTHEGSVACHQPGVFKPFHGLAYVAHPRPPRLSLTIYAVLRAAPYDPALFPE